MTNYFGCPIFTCPFYNQNNEHTFRTTTSLIRHLKSDEHKHSRHLLDHTLCNKVNIFRCTHRDCSDSNNIFFASERAYNDHNLTTHNSTPTICLEIDTSRQHTDRQLKYTETIYSTTNNFDLESQWNTGLRDINDNYKCNPPQFRSSWRRYLNGNNKKWFLQPLQTL